MTYWCYCPNPKCPAPPLDGDLGAIPGGRCYWCGTTIEAMPPEAYEEDDDD